MSDRFKLVRRARRDRRRARGTTGDRGITIVEVLMSIILTGLVSSVLATAVVVTVRQQANTMGRLNVAREEQNIGVWLPADLASAEDVSTGAADSPCGGPCPAGTTLLGSNALMLSWHSMEAGVASGVDVLTVVSYRYAQVDGEYVMQRVECRTVGTNPVTCQSAIILRDLDPPPLGTTFVAGVTVPSWAVQVTAPLDPGETDPGGPVTTVVGQTTVPTKDAQRVLVTINGGGNGAGNAGGTNQIVLSAGGTTRQEIDGDSVNGTPSFNLARSRCGGNITLIVDESTSIGSTAIAQVRTAVADFVTLFAGTPVKLQVVRFADQASVLGATGWTKWFNMLDTTDVSTLTTAAAGLQSNGFTNWEDALFRTFYNSDGTVQSILPDMVVFFTDGVPTRSRVEATSATAPITPPARLPGFASSSQFAYDQEAFYRANLIAQVFRGSVQMIGVGVGSGILDESTWLEGSPTVTHYQRGNNVIWERNNNVTWQRNNNVIWERNNNVTWQRNNNIVWERNNNFAWQRNNNIVWERNNNLIYERGYHLVGSTKTYTAPFSLWETSNYTSFSASNANSTDTDGWRTRYTTPSATWSSSTQAIYDKANSTTDAADGWRTRLPSTSTNWTAVTEAQYEGSNTTADATDGWRTNYPSASATWTTVLSADYAQYNTVAAATDGWRTRLPSTSTSWTDVPMSEYDLSNTTTDATDGWRPNFTSASPSWTSITSAEYAMYNTLPSGSDGWRTSLPSASASWTNVLQSEYELSNTVGDATDGWRVDYPSVSTTWTSVTSLVYAQYNSVAAATDGWRTRQTASSSTWTDVAQSEFDASNTTTDATDGWRIYEESFILSSQVENATILRRLISGNDNGVPAELVGGQYVNADQADNYILPSWDQFGDALQAVALAECGGTLTLQTKVGTSAAGDPFTYQNTRTLSASGAALDTGLKVVTTTSAFPSGTFDFSLPTGGYVTVDVQPLNISNLLAYNPGTWACRAGGAVRNFTSVPIEGSTWTGIRVQVGANEAVSCTQTVTRKP